jgi:hypothetical protein
VGRNTFYSFGMAVAASPDLIAGEFRLVKVKARDPREDLNLQFRLPSHWRVGELRGRTREVGIIDEGNFRLAGTHTGRMSSASPNITSHAKVWPAGPTWVDPDPQPVVDDEAMQMICNKAGEPTSMTDPYLLLKHRDRSYGDKRRLAYA